MRFGKTLAAALVLAAAAGPVVAQTNTIQAQVDARLTTERARLTEQEERYEQIEIMARLLDRGLSRYARVGSVIDPMHSAAFSPDGRTLATVNDSSIRLWDAATGKQIAGHPALTVSAMQGVYLKGRGVVYTVTIPQHFQKPVAGPDKPAPKALTPWERVRKELRGEKVEAEKPKERDDSSIADAVLKVLAENGKNLTNLPDNESVTVAITLATTNCAQCHAGTGAGSGRSSSMGGSGGGILGPGLGSSSSGGTISRGTSFNSAPFGGASSSTTGSTTGGSASTSGSSGTTSTIGQDSAAARAEFRKQALLGDLAMKQNDFAQAADAYRKAMTDSRRLPYDSATELEVIEVASKWARSLLAQGKADEAEKVLQGLVKMTDRLGSAERPGKPAAEKPSVPLPPKLVVTVPKTLLEQAGLGKMTFDEFRKAASVEYLTFDKGAAKP